MFTLRVLKALNDIDPVILLNLVLFLELFVSDKILNLDVFLAAYLESYDVRFDFSSQQFSLN
jgi:hypothetical protein